MRSGWQRCSALLVQSDISFIGVFVGQVHVKRKFVTIGRERSELLKLVVYVEDQGARVL